MTLPHTRSLNRAAAKNIFSLLLTMQLPSLAPLATFVLSLKYPLEPWLIFAVIAISLLVMEYLLAYYRNRVIWQLQSLTDHIEARVNLQLYWLLPMVGVWCAFGVSYTFATGFQLLLWWPAVILAAACTMVASFMLSFGLQK